MIKGILSSCLLIIAILFIRKVSQGHIKKRIQYGLWILVALKLLIFPVPWVTSPIAIFSSNDAKVSSSSTELTTINSHDIGIETEAGIESTVKTTYDEKVAIDEVSKDKLVKVENDAVKHKGISFYIGRILKVTFIVIWAIGSLLLAVKFISQNYILKRVLSENSKKYKQKEVPLNVYVVDDLATPCLYNGNIYAREDLLKNPKQRKHILAHEYCHYKHGDSVWSVVRCICLIAYWWNPLVWLAVRLSKTDCELACDEAVLDLIGDEERISYGKTLIGILPSKGNKFFLVASTMEGSKNSMKDRIKFIANKTKVRSSICVAVTLLSIATLACSCTVKPKDKVSLTTTDVEVQSSKDNSETENKTKNDDKNPKDSSDVAGTEEVVKPSEKTSEEEKNETNDNESQDPSATTTADEIAKSSEEASEEVDEQNTTDEEFTNYLNHPSEVVEDYARGVIELFANKNWDNLSDNLMYPIYVKGKTYNNKEEFLAEDLDAIFSDEYINELKNINLDDRFTNWQGICLSNGILWFNQDEEGNLKVSGIN